MKPFNVSYSLYKTWKDSPLQFYFQNLQDTEPDTSVYDCYGKAGNCVHPALEEYSHEQNLYTSSQIFDHNWEDFNLDNLTGFGGNRLDKIQYNKYFTDGTKIIDQLIQDGYELIPEYKFEYYDPILKITFKGFIDLVAKKGDEVIIIDWKTDSKTKKEHKIQQIFYAMAYQHEFGVIPSQYIWHYLKLDKTLHTKQITQSEIDELYKDITKMVIFTRQHGDNVDMFEAGDYTNPFNAYRGICEKTLMDRMNKKTSQFTITVKGNFAQLSGDVHYTIHNVLEKKMEYLEKDRFFKIKNLMDKYVFNYRQLGHERKEAEQMAREKLDHIGRHNLYNRKNATFPIGMLDRVEQTLREFCQYRGTRLQLEYVDERQKYTEYLWKIETDKTLRKYQQTAIDMFMEKKNGVLALCTGAGKTFIAAHIIQKMGLKTLILIDRIELMDQLHEVLSDLLNIPIGRIGDGICELESVTIATVQTLSRDDLSKEVVEHLKYINFLIFDEFHKAATETYYEAVGKMPNVFYRLGLTATPERVDGKTLALQGLIGEILLEIKTKDLIELGYLMNPEITFYRVPISQKDSDSYAKDYEASIVKNEWRNAKIQQVIEQNKGKKILVLTKLVEKHGNVLSDRICPSVHIKSGMKGQDRKDFMKLFREEDGTVLITTTQIAGTGLDIADLDIIINASGNDSKINTIQMIGRVLRTSKGKKSARYIDFLDGGHFTEKNSRNRIKQLKDEGYEVNIE